MKRPSFFPRFTSVLLLSLMLFCVPAKAQDDIGLIHTNSLTAMKAGEWAKALALLTTAVNRYDKNAKTLFGSKFGWFWYHKGYCELKLKKYAEAQTSFESCYKKYPNDLKAQGNNDENQSINLYHIRSLLKWGEAAQGAKEYETAIRMFKKFLEERKPDPVRNPYERGAFYINLSICYFKLFKVPQGLEHLETAIENKDTFPTPDAGILSSFQSFVQAVIEKEDGRAFFDFLDKHRADITLEPFQLYEYAPIFMRLAADALEADLDRVAFELYALVPSTRGVLQDTASRISSLGNVKKPFQDGSKTINKERIQATLELARTQQRSGTPPEVTALAATAFVHEKNANVRGAFASYLQLENYFPKTKKREDYLYNLVRTSSIVGEVLETEKFGSRFLKAFPGSDHEESVRNMMLTSLFYEGEYLKCIEVAEVMIKKLPKPSEQHDICLHVLGGSYYYTGRYEDAQPLVEQHVKEYPKSTFKMASRYFEGSNQSRLQFWSQAAVLLDGFLKDYPSPRENIYLPFALYDRANCHYAEDEMEPALVKLTRLETEFPSAEIMDMTFNLKGNVLQTMDDFDGAEKYYLQALALSERVENRIVSGEALYYLVGLLGAEKRGKEENPRVADAVPFYDKFWANYGTDSPYKPQVAVAGIFALTKAGRGDEALDRLQGVIAELAQLQGAFGLEEAINSYTKAYLEEHSPTELKDHYYSFKGIDANNRTAQALLRIAIIGVFEGVLKKANKKKDENAARDATAMINVLFKDMKEEFKPAELSGFILVSLGDYLREKTSAPRQALPYYEEVKGRSDPTYLFKALFGIADVYGQSDNAADNDKALESLKRIYADAQKKEEKERSLYRIVTILAKKGAWKEVGEQARVYLGEKGFKKYKPWCSLLLAKSYDKQPGKSGDAVREYMKVWAAYTGYIEVSAPAVKRIIEITWANNKAAVPPRKSDRQTAYEFGWNYTDSTKHIRNGSEIKDAEKKIWDEISDLVQGYEDSPKVIDMDTIKKKEEEQQGRR